MVSLQNDLKDPHQSGPPEGIPPFSAGGILVTVEIRSHTIGAWRYLEKIWPGG